MMWQSSKAGLAGGAPLAKGTKADLILINIVYHKITI